MKKMVLVLAALLFSSSLFAQAGSTAGSTASSGATDPRQVLEAFCATHATECAQLKTLHETAHQACANGQQQSTACRQARDNVHTQMQKLESLGLPRPARPPGPPPGDGDSPPPPPDADAPPPPPR